MYRMASCLARIIVVATLAACSRQLPEPSGTASAGEPGSATVAAARAFLGALPDSARGVALLPFEEDERRRWFFVPTELVPEGRSGLPLKRMGPAERTAAWNLLQTGLGPEGLRTARAIMENETRLGELERATGSLRYARDPELYYFSIFGTPSESEPWGWRIDGHHLSVHVTAAGPALPAVGPVFMGANPHRIPSGAGAGTRILAREEDVARELLALFDAEQRARVIVADTTYGEIRTRNDPTYRPLPLEGLAAREMTPTQRGKLRELLELYASRIAPPAAREQLDRIERVGFDQLRFVWAGRVERGQAHYYRVHGPTVLIEYDNSQNQANHSHTVWRDVENDFGGDLLKRHYQRHPH